MKDLMDENFDKLGVDNQDSKGYDRKSKDEVVEKADRMLKNKIVTIKKRE